MSTTNYFPSGGEGWARLHAGTLSCHVDDYAVWLADRGYARVTGRQKLRLVGQFSHWMEDRGLKLSAVDERLLERFRISRSRLGKATASVSSDRRHFLAWLRNTARLAPLEPEPSHHDPVMETVDRYERFHIDKRGVRSRTALTYISTVRAFLGYCLESTCNDLESLDCSHLNGFIRQSCRTQCPATTRVHVAALRSFARYLYRSGIVTADIADEMGRVSTWRLANLPNALAPDQIEAMLASCNRVTATGRRDYDVLMLRALLWLRACEVVHLTLNDIDWSNGEIAVAGKGGRHDVLPLPQRVGEALAAYLQGRIEGRCLMYPRGPVDVERCTGRQSNDIEILHHDRA